MRCHKSALNNACEKQTAGLRCLSSKVQVSPPYNNTDCHDNGLKELKLGGQGFCLIEHGGGTTCISNPVSNLCVHHGVITIRGEVLKVVSQFKYIRSMFTLMAYRAA